MEFSFEVCTDAPRSHSIVFVALSSHTFEFEHYFFLNSINLRARPCRDKDGIRQGFAIQKGDWFDATSQRERDLVRHGPEPQKRAKTVIARWLDALDDIQGSMTSKVNGPFRFHLALAA